MSSKFIRTVSLNRLVFRYVQNYRYSTLLTSRPVAAVQRTLFAGKQRPEPEPEPLHQQWRLSKAKEHNWKRQMDYNDRRRKVIPKLVYLHNPWKYFVTKMNWWKLRLLWDRDFAEQEFIRGSTQAAIVITNIIRSQNTGKISKFTTPIGFQQITRDMLLSRNDSRLKLVKFDPEHIRKAIPMKVATRKNYGRKYCFIDMLFVGLRNTKDFDSPAEAVEIKEVLRKLDSDMHTPMEVLSVPHRIVFAEIFMRFRRDYSDKNNSENQNAEDKEWSVSFYKILTFDVLNYDPK